MRGTERIGGGGGMSVGAGGLMGCDGILEGGGGIVLGPIFTIFGGLFVGCILAMVELEIE